MYLLWILLACREEEAYSEGSNLADCTDGIDNDGDGFIDCDDGVCAALSAACNPPDCGLTDCDQGIALGDDLVVDFVLIPKGEEPLERYRLQKDFYMMTTEVTQRMFKRLMGYEAYQDYFATSGE